MNQVQLNEYLYPIIVSKGLDYVISNYISLRNEYYSTYSK